MNWSKSNKKTAKRQLWTFVFYWTAEKHAQNTHGPIVRELLRSTPGEYVMMLVMLGGRLIVEL
jgi:hypothetical protein